jgi:hypothetical protein
MRDEGAAILGESVSKLMNLTILDFDLRQNFIFISRNIYKTTLKLENY